MIYNHHNEEELERKYVALKDSLAKKWAPRRTQ